MLQFAERTGLTSPRPPVRYLWTDAFAVCNYLTLFERTGQAQFSELAWCLIEQVHQVLGRHRSDDSRQGWISGLNEQEGAEHPTAGGLRIGKKMPERRPEEPFDERLEWDRDGQYFHYLTRWIQALDAAATRLRRPELYRQAWELLQVAAQAFSHTRAGRPMLYWKMSIDLRRPLVPSMGQHDALDGLLCCLRLQRSGERFGGAPEELPRLTEAFARMAGATPAASSDPLGLGGLLIGACQLARSQEQPLLLRQLLQALRSGLSHYLLDRELERPASRRLAFRELGLSIGLHGVPQLPTGYDLELYEKVGAAIESFWLRPQHQQVPTWQEHRDINEVMLATSLAPDVVLQA